LKHLDTLQGDSNKTRAETGPADHGLLPLLILPPSSRITEGPGNLIQGAHCLLPTLEKGRQRSG
jgi:hypothetical protein